MKKIATALIVSSLFLSCHSDDSEPVFTPKVGLETTFLKATHQHSLSNIQVGDTLTYTFHISENRKSDKFAIVPESNNSIKHQFMDVDYELLYNDNKVNAIETTEKTGNFKIVVKKAGNFQHSYKVISYKDNDIFESQTTDLIFNAIKITAYRYNWKYKNGGSFSHSKWRYFHKLYIDTGEQQYDNYLNNLSYQIRFDNYNHNFSNFEKNTNMNFYQVQHYQGGDNPTQYSNIDKIIFKKEYNGNISLIEYHNIPVLWLGRHDNWGYNGNNNW